MIGVIADPTYEAVVTEFFELFKTPWEFYRSGQRYEMLLCDKAGYDTSDANVVFIFNGENLSHQVTGGKGETARRRGNGRFFVHKGFRVPIYGNTTTFPDSEDDDFLVDAESKESAAYIERVGERVLVRVGYDLFHEIRVLLTQGQPASNAAIPTLDLHISLLRDLIVATGMQIVEIRPVPQGYQFVACLTHDVDHPLLRKHRFDRTMFGFLYRALFRSPLNMLRGRAEFRHVLTNWAAALKLPFVHLGLAKDCWQGFDRYPQLEAGPRSSFFVIPFKNDPGRIAVGAAPKHRGAAYRPSDIAAQIQTLISKGCEIGLHGIDAWRDPAKGREELNEIRRVTGIHDIGVRMHWLCFDEGSPATLEKAGADYDSSVGYNETVGYRAGTTQVYKPLETASLLELPLHIMDTALFFPGYLDLSSDEANKVVDQIIENAVRFGGVVTVNWHDRSIAPERLWGDFYAQLLEKLKEKGAWFATAGETVRWFRNRRSFTFDTLRSESNTVPARAALEAGAELPELRVTLHDVYGIREIAATATSTFIDKSPDEAATDLSIAPDSNAEIRKVDTATV